eukprot:10074673-Alexandrium_andersonii.AAC.1
MAGRVRLRRACRCGRQAVRQGRRCQGDPAAQVASHAQVPDGVGPERDKGAETAETDDDELIDELCMLFEEDDAACAEEH